MIAKILRWTVLILMILNGLFFMSNIYVIGNTDAAIKMHDDLSPLAGPAMANAKVINVFLVGLLYLAAVYGMIKKKPGWILCGVIGALLFLALYIVELILWSHTHPRVWLDFSIFGGISIIYGVFSFFNWRKVKEVNT